MRLTLFSLLFLVLFAVPANAQDEQGKEQGPPPAKVVTATATSGQVRPVNVYVGSIYFPEVSNVATEVSGLAGAVAFDEGQHVAEGQELVRLSSDLTRKQLESAQAQYKKVLADLENAELDYARMDALYQSRSVSEQEYDQARLNLKALREQARALEAEAGRLRLLLNKTVIRAPFSGVILAREVERGEWLAQGSVVGALARDDYLEAVVEIPQQGLRFVTPGQKVEVETADRRLEGEILAVIPSGDVATRTFPVKVKVANPGGLAQGMEARVSLPSGEPGEATLVPRDAVIQSRGQFVVFAVDQGQEAAPATARMIPVEVTSYQGMEAAVRGENLTPGTVVVVKGQERLRPGQPVQSVKPTS